MRKGWVVRRYALASVLYNVSRDVVVMQEVLAGNIQGGGA